MDNENLGRLDSIGFDEQSETWFVDTRERPRITLDRQTLQRLVERYNAIHRGNPLHLVGHAEIRRLEQNNRRLSETVRDLYLHIDRARHNRIDRRIGRYIATALRLVSRLRGPSGA